MSDSVRPHRLQPTRVPPDHIGVVCHFLLQCMKAKSESEVTTESRPTPSDPMDCSPPGSSIHGIFQARVLEWGATECIRVPVSPHPCQRSLLLNVLFVFVLAIVCNCHSAPAAKLLQSCPTLCDPIDGSPPGSRVPGILQARTLEWVAISFSNAQK